MEYLFAALFHSLFHFHSGGNEIIVVAYREKMGFYFHHVHV